MVEIGLSNHRALAGKQKARLKKIHVVSSVCRSLKSGAYQLMFGSEEIPVYCHMGKAGNKTGCGDGGWTLAIKMNGTKVHFFSTFYCLIAY